jgi:hypothetical protein
MITLDSTLYNRLTLMSSSLHEVPIPKEDHEFVGVLDLSSEKPDIAYRYLIIASSKYKNLP